MKISKTFLGLILLTGLGSFFFVQFDLKIDLPYFLLFCLEALIILHFYSKNKTLFIIILTDFLLFIIQQNILPFLIEFQAIDLQTRVKIYEYSKPYYHMIMLYRVIAVHAVALSYLTFGLAPKLKSIIYTTVFTFIISYFFQKFMSLSEDSIMVSLSIFGVFNYTFYLKTVMKRKINLGLKRELLFLFYLIGFSLSILEYIPIFGSSHEYFSTTFNYVLYLFMAFLIIKLPEKTLFDIIFQAPFKLTLIGITIMLGYLEFNPSLYYMQRIFILVILISFLFLTESQKYILKTVK